MVGLIHRGVRESAVGAAVAFASLTFSSAEEGTPPPFKVTAIEGRSILSVLVAPTTSDDQLRALIRAFRRARQSGTLGALGIPPTTQGGTKEPYAVVGIYVFTEPKWATSEMLHKAHTVPSRSPFDYEFGSHVRAYYYYYTVGLLGQPEEQGTLGYAEHKRIYTKRYEKLF
jgi:hypothetical protein